MPSDEQNSPVFEVSEQKELTNQEKVDAIISIFENAETSHDLKFDWEVYGQNGPERICYLSKEEFGNFRDRIFEQLVRLGMDVNSEDDRISELVGRFGAPPTFLENSIILDATLGSLDRLIGAIDPEKNNFELMPFEKITLLKSPDLRFNDAKVFCANSGVLSHHGPKYYRQVFSPASEFHGIGIYYDDFPTEPNITISISTSRIRLSDLELLDPDLKYDRAPGHNDEHYVPTRVMARHVQLGDVATDAEKRPNFTTPVLDSFLLELHSNVVQQENRKN